MFNISQFKIRVMGSDILFSVNASPDEVVTMGQINHLIEVFTLFGTELKLIAAILLAQSGDGVCGAEILALLRRRLDQPSSYENYAATCERRMLLDDLAVELLKQFQGNQAVSKEETTESHIVPLSEREFEVLRLIADGSSNKEIADRLYIGLSTVKKHINHIYDKLDAKNRTQAVNLARERLILTS